MLEIATDLNVCNILYIKNTPVFLQVLSFVKTIDCLHYCLENVLTKLYFRKRKKKNQIFCLI